MSLLWLTVFFLRRLQKGICWEKQFMLLLEVAIWDTEISILDFYYLKLHWQTP